MAVFFAKNIFLTALLRKKLGSMNLLPKNVNRFVRNNYPWPQTATVKQIDAVAEAARELRRVRAEALPKIKGGLRALYRTLELPGANPLKDAHAALDTAVLAAYGFSSKTDLLAQLLALNRETVTAPGIPPGFPTPETLVTGDCIRPATSPH